MSRNSIEIFLALMDNILILIFGTAPTGLIYLIVVLKISVILNPFLTIEIYWDYFIPISAPTVWFQILDFSANI